MDDLDRTVNDRLRVLEDRMRTMEVVLWGPDGRNGLRSDMKALADNLRRFEEKVDTRFDQVQLADNTELADNFRSFKNTVLLVALGVLAFAGAIVAAVIAGAFH